MKMKLFLIKMKLFKAWMGFCVGGIYAMMWIADRDLAIVITAGLIGAAVVWLFSR